MNLILLAVDALRSDALSCYGNPRQTSPNVDHLAREGTMFRNFYSVGNCTHPGFTAMFTGMYPESSGVVSHWTKVAPPDGVMMMAEYFHDTGFAVAAVDNLYDGWRPAHPFYPWFRRGYSHYVYPRGEGFFQPASEVSRMACEWLDSDPKEPFSLFIHYWDTHSPYNKAPAEFYRFYAGDDPCDPRLDYMPPDVRETQRRIFEKPITDPSYIVSAYHGETAYVDECIGAVVRKVAKLGLLGDTTFIVTSDHGEIMARPRLALGRLWAFCHIGLNEDCLRLPLIMKGPDIESAQCVDERFQLVDLLPSILGLAEIVSNSKLDGRSFEPALRGENVEGRKNLFFSENTYQKQRAVLSGPWKYMRMETLYNSMPPKCLYNLKIDPSEIGNLSDSEAGIVRKMDKLLDDYVAQTSPQGQDPIESQQTTARF